MVRIYVKQVGQPFDPNPKPCTRAARKNLPSCVVPAQCKCSRTPKNSQLLYAFHALYCPISIPSSLSYYISLFITHGGGRYNRKKQQPSVLGVPKKEGRNRPPERRWQPDLPRANEQVHHQRNSSHRQAATGNSIIIMINHDAFVWVAFMLRCQRTCPRHVAPHPKCRSSGS